MLPCLLKKCLVIHALYLVLVVTTVSDTYGVRILAVAPQNKERQKSQTSDRSRVMSENDNRNSEKSKDKSQLLDENMTQCP